jgi:peptidoglycan-associated lipoprotein
MMRHRHAVWSAAALALVMTAACAKPKPPVARPIPPPPPGGTSTSNPPPPGPTRPPEPVIESSIPAEPKVTSDPLSGRDIDEINKNSPFQPVFFGLDLDSLDDTAKQALTTNAELMKKYPTFVITIEGHADERGTAEYNLALGERRATAARNFLVSLGISAERLRTVSYGKEFPFDPGHDESAWSKNRRAHFVVTSK